MAATTTAASDVAAVPGRTGPANLEIGGLRAVAALMVLVTHVSLNAMGNRGPWGGLLARLDAGVAVFFVLSGFLLYRPFARAILREEPRPRFRRYLRHRLVRIVPAYWVVVIASFLFPPAVGLVLPTTDFSAAASGVTEVPLAMLARFASFTQIYWRDSLGGPFPQAWTLATEMAFYLVLPVIVWAMSRWGGVDRATRVRRQWWLLGGMVVTATLYRLAMVLVVDAYGAGADAATEVTQFGAWLPNHLDLFAVGMAMAVLSIERTDGGPSRRVADRIEGLYSRPGAAEASLAVAVGVLAVAGYGLGLSRTDLTYGRGGEFGRHLSYLVVAAALVAPTVFGRDRRSGYRSFLRSRPMQFLGKISYGIYLWQILVIGRWVSSPFTADGVPDPARNPGLQFNVAFWPTLAWTFVVTVILATISWYAVERPWMRFRDRRLGVFWAGTWTVAVVSFATRIWSFGTTLERNPGNGDPFFYHAQANMLADGVGFGEPIQWLTEGRFVASAIHPPLFTLWLTPASMLGARSYLSHKTMAAFAGVALVVIAALLVRRLAGDRAGALAAVLVALYPNLWIIDGTLWPEGLYTALVGSALLAAYRWREHPSWWGSVAIGAAVGLAVLTRGEALLLLAMLCLPLVVAARRTVADWWKHGLVMAAVAGGLVLPWTIRNVVVFEVFVPVSTNSDEVLYYANCPDTYEGPLIGYWSFGCQQRARAEREAAGLPPDPPGDESERAKGWGEVGREYAFDNTDRWPAVVAARVTRAWDLQHSDNTALALQLEGRPKGWTERGQWVWWALLAPGVAGLVVLRRREVAIWPLISMLAMVTVTAVAVYGHPRFRTVGDLVIVLGAAVAIDAVLPRRRAPDPATEPATEPA